LSGEKRRMQSLQSPPCTSASFGDHQSELLCRYPLEGANYNVEKVSSPHPAVNQTEYQVEGQLVARSDILCCHISSRKAATHASSTRHFSDIRQQYLSDVC
jgi:hypothetical protein